jgi:hypothetical protein
MLQIKVFGLEKEDNKSLDIKSYEIEDIINTWLIDNNNIEIVSTNVSSGGSYTSGEKYYILYRIKGETNE